MSSYCHLCDADPCYCGQHGTVTPTQTKTIGSRRGPRGLDDPIRDFVLTAHEDGVREDWGGWLNRLVERFDGDYSAVRNAWNRVSNNLQRDRVLIEHPDEGRPMMPPSAYPEVRVLSTEEAIREVEQLIESGDWRVGEQGLRLWQVWKRIPNVVYICIYDALHTMNGRGHLVTTRSPNNKPSQFWYVKPTLGREVVDEPAATEAVVPALVPQPATPESLADDFPVVGVPTSTDRVFSYVVKHDSGFAPNPFHGLLTLACCKPKIRKNARVNNIIVGLSSRCERVVYAAQVDEVIDFEEYWADPRFESRRPTWDSPRIVDRAGDNIYEPVPDGFRQLPSMHSHDDGSENPHSKRTDLSGQHILVCERFTYWGGSGPQLPEELEFLSTGRGHRSRFSEEQVDTVARWFSTLPGGVLGAPRQWKAGDESWRQT